MLTLSNIRVSYDGSRILRDVSLTVKPGEVVAAEYPPVVQNKD